ncbi:MAG: cobalt ECF transporter T component CbiQ [Verrucomicrobiota bacterium]|jgi:cobalt/nickel transport system permease protein
MSANLLGPPPSGRGPLHRLPAAAKLAAAVALVLAVVLLPGAHWRWLLAVAAALALLAWLSRLPWFFLLKRLLLLEPFVFGVAGLMLFQPDGAWKFALALFKTNLCLLTTLLLSNTTPFTGLLSVLQRLRVPWLFVTTLTLMHRYLFVLADESERMRRARASRTIARSRGFQWRTLSSVVGLLFVRASERAERIYDAMCARGWK